MNGRQLKQSPLLSELQYWLNGSPNCIVSHIPREGNKAADSMAGMAMNGDFDIYSHARLPSQLYDILQSDCWVSNAFDYGLFLFDLLL